MYLVGVKIHLRNIGKYYKPHLNRKYTSLNETRMTKM